MRAVSFILLISFVGLVLATLVWLGRMPGHSDATGPGNAPDLAAKPVFRLGITPERDPRAQQQRYQPLVDHLSRELERRVQLASLNTYQGVLLDLQEKQLDAAFVGSMIAILAHDRLGARIMAKTEYPDGVSTYRGVVFVREDSPIQALPQLRGQSIAMVRTTMAGNLYPVWLLARNDLLAAAKGHFRWVGTHDEVIRRVLDGSVAVGAVKDLRLAAYLAQNPSARVRQLAVSAPVPENALILRGDLSEEMTRRLEKAILAMHQTDAGRAALAAFGAARFLPCDLRDYRALYQMVEDLGPDWREVGVAGDPPHWPETSPQTAPAD